MYGTKEPLRVWVRGAVVWAEGSAKGMGRYVIYWSGGDGGGVGSARKVGKGGHLAALVRILTGPRNGT